MTGGDIAGLIAAGVFAVLVALLAIPLFKLGKVLDETSAAIRELSDNVTPLLEEATTTISESNKQIVRLDTITGDIAETTGNVTALVALFAASVGGPLIKVAAFSAGVRAAFTGIKPFAKRSKHTK
jgi:phage-related minor tail protein